MIPDMMSRIAGVGTIDVLLVGSALLPSMLTAYLAGNGISVLHKSYVATHIPSSYSCLRWPLQDGEGPYFSGNYPVPSGIDVRIDHKFSGDILTNDNSLLIVAAAYEKGVVFNALCTLLECTFGRGLQFISNPDLPPTLAFFEEVRNPATRAVTAAKVIVPVIRDPGVPWHGYIPIENGVVSHGISLGSVLAQKT